MNKLKLSLALFVLVGCGSTPAPLDADVATDAPESSTLDTPVVAPDFDEDGVESAFDCDDTDATVGANAVIDCTSPCGNGTILCENGFRGECDAPRTCLCDTPDENRIVDCGNCGMQPQTCSDGVWTDDGACLYEGECEVAATEDDASQCGLRRRLCSSDCEWLEWFDVEPRGVCEPGEDVPCRGGGTARCSATCTLICIPAS